MALDISPTSYGIGRGPETLSLLADPTRTAEAATLVSVTLLVSVIWVIYYFSNQEKAKKWFIPLVLLWVLQSVQVTNVMRSEPVSTMWQADYQQALMLQGYGEYLQDTGYYDYDSAKVSSVAKDILAKSNNEQQAIENTLVYVYDNVEYNVGETDDVCFAATAEKVLNSGSGQCDTQTITVVSILRKMGIAARPVGGCLAVKNKLMAAVLPKVPRYMEITVVAPGKEYSRKGGLHAWAEAWVPDKGWMTLEATTGEIANEDAFDYVVELYPEDGDLHAVCVSDDYKFALECSKR